MPPPFAMRFFSDLKKKKTAVDEALPPSKHSNSVALPATPPHEASRRAAAPHCPGCLTRH